MHFLIVIMVYNFNRIGRADERSMPVSESGLRGRDPNKILPVPVVYFYMPRCNSRNNEIKVRSRSGAGEYGIKVISRCWRRMLDVSIELILCAGQIDRGDGG